MRMPRTREEIWKEARRREPNDHLDRALKTIKDIRKELENASTKQDRIPKGPKQSDSD